MNIKIFADGANIEDMIRIHEKIGVDGFTTNPSLMKQAGIKNYKEFSKKVVGMFPNKSVSFEVFSDDFETMEKEARELSKIGNNVFVKIPITNSKGEGSFELIRKLSSDGINLNVTAIFTKEQVEKVVDSVNKNSKTIISVFAGRIADTGVDPTPLMREYSEICHKKENIELLWASPREVLNIKQAEEVGCDIITCTPQILNKIKLFGKNLEEYSLETVQMFLRDSTDLGYKILD
ncbi:MAG: transaldolase [Tissierellia bacterium]|nr:transaldolase [Tissierellia bacterium]